MLEREMLINRGYTSHEHICEAGLIHMNGRLYDPLLRRFLSADENIQDPYNTQNYNKYGYVLNNPLMYNDPSGEFFAFLGLGILFWKAVIIGAAVGLASYSIGVAVTGQKWSLGGALKATFWGAVGGAASFGIGSIFTNVAGTATAIADALGKFGTVIVQGGCHAISQGVLSVFQGSSFLSGALGGALGSWAASGFGAIAGDWASKTGGQIFFGALSGGVGAELSGGNFWQGAVTGGIVAGLNHAMHTGDSETTISDDRNGDCPTCPKNAKEGQAYSVPGGKSQMFDRYVYKDGEWITWFDAHAVTGTVPIGPGGAAKGLKWLNKYGSKGAEISVTKIGEFTKYTAKVLAQNGNGSYTVHTKYLNSYGKTVRYFHDTYNSTGRFIHRGWTEGSTKVHLWWNGVKQYGQHFFQNR